MNILPGRRPPWVRKGILVFIGYLLSPLSWWNDAFVNLPLAYALGSLFGLINKELFLPATIFSYWLSNTVGFILLHHGLADAPRHERSPYTKKDFISFFLISLAYTLLMIGLISMGWLRFPADDTHQ